MKRKQSKIRKQRRKSSKIRKKEERRNEENLLHPSLSRADGSAKEIGNFPISLFHEQSTRGGICFLNFQDLIDSKITGVI